MCNKFKENGYFIRQDIISYLMSTILYIGLCLIKNCSWQSFGYGLFECLVFYLPFWFIRICFSATYHSDNWFHCRFWTRIMLCGGVTPSRASKIVPMSGVMRKQSGTIYMAT